MPENAKKTKIGMFEILDILNLRAPGTRGPSVADLVLKQCRHSGEMGPEPAYLLLIDGSYVDVYEVEGEPLHITIRYTSDEHEPDRAAPPNQAEENSESEYNFRDRHTTPPSTILPRDAFARKVVAFAGPNGDWAAYEGPSQWSDERVIRQGLKLAQDQAEPLFYVMRTTERSYGEPRPRPDRDQAPQCTFKNKVTTRPCDVQSGDAFALRLVAVAGFGDDWAAYEGPSDWSDEKVARQGDKLHQEAAESVFLTMYASGRYYRL